MANRAYSFRGRPWPLDVPPDLQDDAMHAHAKTVGIDLKLVAQRVAVLGVVAHQEVSLLTPKYRKALFEEDHGVDPPGLAGASSRQLIELAGLFDALSLPGFSGDVAGDA